MMTPAPDNTVSAKTNSATVVRNSNMAASPAIGLCQRTKAKLAPVVSHLSY
jgi:hypothetical protein